MKAEPTLQPCQTCQNTFLPRRPWQKFCSDRCRVSWHKEQKSPQILKDIIKDLQAQISELEARLEKSEDRSHRTLRDKGELGRDLAKTSQDGG